MRDIRPLLLILLSTGLVATWVYHIYDKTRYTRIRNEVFVRDSAAVAAAVRDSLSLIFTNTIHTMDARLDSTRSSADSLRQDLSGRVAVINQLRQEIGSILSKTSVSQQDLDTAREKINELQQLVASLRARNTSMEEEKQHLTGILDQLGKTADSLQKNIRRLSDENTVLQEKVGLAAIFVASEIRLSAVDVRGDREDPTNVAKKADKFIVSFVLQNNVNDYNGAEVAVLVIQPDKKVLQNVNWNSGQFETRQEGRKAFTRMVRFDYERGERKELQFTLDPDDFLKGNYVLQVWHKGVLIGSSGCSLQ